MSDTPRTDHLWKISNPRLTVDTAMQHAEHLERERNILFEAVTDAIERFDRISWGWDGDCGSGNIMQDLEEARDKVCTSNPGRQPPAPGRG